MRHDPPTGPLTRAQVDRVLAFLSLLEAPGADFGQDHAPTLDKKTHAWHVGFAELSPLAAEFLQALYDTGFIFSFDWVSWQRQARRYVDSPSLLASARFATLRSLLTTHARADRFVEGRFLAMLRSGHIAAILRRLAELRDSCSRGAAGARERP